MIQLFAKLFALSVLKYFIISSVALYAHPITVTVDCKDESKTTSCDTYRINYVENIASQKATYTGQIVDENGTAVSSAPVFLYGDVWYSEGYTDAAGNFSILVTPDSDFRIKAYAKSWKIWPEYNGTIPGIPAGETHSLHATQNNMVSDFKQWVCENCTADNNMLTFNTGSGGTGFATFNFPAENKVKTGDTYRIKFTVDLASGSIRYAVGGYVYEDVIRKSGAYEREYVVTTKAPYNLLYFLDGESPKDKNGFTGTISKITLTKE